MKYTEIIKEVKDLYPNEYSESELKKWIYELEQTAAVYSGEAVNAPENLNCETLIKEPFDRMYLDYVMAQASLHQHDDESYSRYISIFNSRYREWQKWYIQAHEGKKIRFKNWI